MRNSNQTDLRFDKIPRLVTAAVVSIPITFGLLYLMHVLIVMGEDVYTDIPKFEVQIVAPPSSLVTEVAEEPRQKPAWEPVPMPSFSVSQAEPGEPFTPVRYMPEPPGAANIGAVSSGPQRLILKILPIYPALALERKTEGYVIVQYDVLPNGEIENAMIVESSDEVFNFVSVQAIRQFRYERRLGDGAGLKTEGLKRMFKFEINRSGTPKPE
jgi:TonB family protein